MEGGLRGRSWELELRWSSWCFITRIRKRLTARSRDSKIPLRHANDGHNGHDGDDDGYSRYFELRAAENRISPLFCLVVFYELYNTTCVLPRTRSASCVESRMVVLGITMSSRFKTLDIYALHSRNYGRNWVRSEGGKGKAHVILKV